MSKLWLILALSLSATTAVAFPEAPFDALKSNIEPPKSLDAFNYDFEGIVKLSNCSGAIIKFTGQNIDDNALVLTNGHCLGRPFLKPGEIVYKKSVNRRMKVADANMKFHNVRAKELVYGTMTDTDAAIYKLKETFRDLENKGISAFELSNTRPYEALPIHIVSGYWERGYACNIDAFIFELREASWTFTDSIRYSSPGCETIGGTSGSPIIATGTRTVVGVNNTGNESGKRCTMNNPCEVDQNSTVTVNKGASYGQQTYQFYTCLDNTFNIDLKLDGCLLPK